MLVMRACSPCGGGCAPTEGPKTLARPPALPSVPFGAHSDREDIERHPTKRTSSRRRRSLARGSEVNAEPRRPSTAQRTGPRLGVFAFPPLLHFCSEGETVLPSLFANRGALLLDLNTQETFRNLAASCSASSVEVSKDTRVTIWAVAMERQSMLEAAQADTSIVLEPLVAFRADRTLAVEPIECVIEGESADADQVCFGQAFRLRIGWGVEYLVHEGNRLWWEAPEAGGVSDRCVSQGALFAAHGGELGTPLVLGRVIALRHMPASEFSGEESSSSVSSCERLLRGMGSPCARRARPRRPGSGRSLHTATVTRSTSDGRSTMGSGTCERLFSYLADFETSVPVVLLPSVLSKT